MKKLFVYLSLALISLGIVVVFWKQELVYNLPTPQPCNYKPVEVGQALVIPYNIEKKNKPLFLHFFNPECPCSRFNIKHFKALIRDYGKQVDFKVVIQSTDSTLSADEIKDEFDLDVECILDRDKKIANSCGVYSTPQAVLTDVTGNLYYRGNYNKARYCTNKTSDFAQIAIDSLLKNSNKPIFSALATRPYGCTLPTCDK
ncbi:MAG: redoxin domain-containing protein [Bacteroidetes bacterium]|nr:redoxin domain-containing protein [Bacteroidota bacterium]